MTFPLQTSGYVTSPALRPALPGLFLAVTTMLFGFGLGIIFGLNEAAIKDRLAASAASVQESAYHGDAAAAKAVLDKSWSYMQRAHLHAGGLGAAAVGLILVLIVLGPRPLVLRVVSLGLGIGTLGYSIFWLWAGFRAPSLGGTGPAKESLAWIAMPSSGLVVVSTIAVATLVLAAMIRKDAVPG